MKTHLQQWTLALLSVGLAPRAGAQLTPDCPPVVRRGADVYVPISGELSVTFSRRATFTEITVRAVDLTTGTPRYRTHRTGGRIPIADVHVVTRDQLDGDRPSPRLSASALHLPHATIWSIVVNEAWGRGPFWLFAVGDDIRCLPASAAPPLLFGTLEFAALLELPSYASLGLKEFGRVSERLAWLPRQVRTYRQTSADPFGGNGDGFPTNPTWLAKRSDRDFVLVDARGPCLLTHTFFNPIDPHEAHRLAQSLQLFVDDLDEPWLKLGAASEMFRGKAGPFTPDFVGFGNGGFWSYYPLRVARHVRIRTDDPTLWHFTFVRGPYAASPDEWRHLLTNRKNPHRVAAEKIPFRHFVLGLDTKEIARFWEPAAVVALEIQVQSDQDWEDLWLEAFFDGQTTPSVRAPIAILFGAQSPRYDTASTLFQREGNRGRFFCPMPFETQAVFRIRNSGRRNIDVSGSLGIVRKRYPKPFGHLHTHFAETRSERRKDVVMLATRGFGKVVASVIETEVAESVLDQNRELWEGDQRIYVDGSRHPALHDTGTEVHQNWGYYGVGSTDTRFTHPTHGYSGTVMQADSNGRVQARSGYRVRGPWDPVFFAEDVRIQLEHGPDYVGYNQNGLYRTLVLYYRTAPVASTVQRIALDSGHDAALRPLSSRSIYHGDQLKPVDRKGGVLVARKTWNVAIPKDNHGILLRAEIERFAIEGSELRVLVDGREAGYLRNPWQARTPHDTLIKFIDLELEIPPYLTNGKSAIALTLEPLESRPMRMFALELKSYR